MANPSPASDFPSSAISASKATRWRPRVLKWVRRAHLYTGLVLLPWVIFFGFSGMLFNHPEFGETESRGSWNGKELAALGFEVVDSRALAAEIVAELNESEAGQDLRLIPGQPVLMDGAIVYQGQAKAGAFTLAIDPSDGNANLQLSPEPRKTPVPPFLGARVDAPTVDGAMVESTVAALLAESGLKPLGKVEPSSRGGAELRFQLESPETGRRWNVSWNLMKGGLTARELGVGGGPDLYTVLTRFHKTHHYPHQFGARWLWNAFADATGLTMVLWGLSGAIMWWQIKPTRLIGIAGLSVAAVLAFFIFAGTYSNLHWVPREARPTSAAGKGSPPTPAGEARADRDKAGVPAAPTP